MLVKVVRAGATQLDISKHRGLENASRPVFGGTHEQLPSVWPTVMPE